MSSISSTHNIQNNNTNLKQGEQWQERELSRRGATQKTNDNFNNQSSSQDGSVQDTYNDQMDIQQDKNFNLSLFDRHFKNIFDDFRKETQRIQSEMDNLHRTMLDTFRTSFGGLQRLSSFEPTMPLSLRELDDALNFEPLHKPLLSNMLTPFKGDSFFDRDLIKDLEIPKIEESMKDFSKTHEMLLKDKQKNAPAKVIERNFVKKREIGPDGNKIEEDFSSTNLSERTPDGDVITERKQKLRNKDGKEKIAIERMLNNKGKKIIQDKGGTNQQEAQVQDYYYNLKNEEVDEFDKLWNDYSSKVGFAKRIHKEEETKQIKQSDNVRIDEEKP